MNNHRNVSVEFEPKPYLTTSVIDGNGSIVPYSGYYNLGDYATAINEMETAIKYEPKHQIAHLNLGIVNLTAQNLQESKEWFRKAVELNPESEAGKRAQELLNSH